MGIPGFSKWITEAAPEAEVDVPQNFAADVVGFDMNEILHCELRFARDEDHAVARTFKSLHATLGLLRPRSAVLIAVDGPAPVAKLTTQRSRRRKGANKAERRKRGGVNPLVITPGTRFMRKVESALQYFVCQEL